MTPSDLPDRPTRRPGTRPAARSSGQPGTAGRHRAERAHRNPRPTRRPRRRSGVRLTQRGRAVLAALITVALVGVAWTIVSGGRPTRSAADPPGTAGTSSSSSASTAVTRAATEAAARRRIAQLIAAAPPGGVSVAVENLTTGATFTAGATSGMMCASTAKVQILESLLAQNQGPLTGNADTLATSMIENSDNDAADALYAQLGGPDDYTEYMHPLGLSAPSTEPGPPYYWGLTTSSAMQHLTLMKNLVVASSPLTPAARQYMLNLMRNVEADQRWGVPEVADPGTTPANKNGWLNITDDNNLWAVNSDGVVTVHGQQLAMSVFTQHSPDMATGQRLLSQLVAAAAQAVAP